MPKILTQLSYFLLFILLFSACKKDDITSQQWDELANKKKEAIDQLIASEVCTNSSEWTIEKVANFWCGHSYYPMHKNIKVQFDKLWNEYINLQAKAEQAGVKEGIIYEPCEEHFLQETDPIQLICENNKAKLLYISDLSLAESKAQIIPVKFKIDTYLAKLTCNGIDNWTTTKLLNDCGYDYLPYLRTADLTEIKKDIALYNSLMLNIISQSPRPCHSITKGYPIGMSCIDNKPIIELSE